MSEKENSKEIPEFLLKEGDIREINGIKYRYTDTGYTMRQWYSKESEKGPGPGWDFIDQLLREEYTREKFGRTFSPEEIAEPELLPDIPYFRWERLDES